MTKNQSGKTGRFYAGFSVDLTGNHWQPLAAMKRFRIFLSMPRQTYDAVIAASKAAGDIPPGRWCLSVIVREVRSLKLLPVEK